MLKESRIDIYDYLYNLLYGVVSENVYDMRPPQELTQSDTEDGFIVIHVGDVVDESEFDGQAFGRVRCFIEAYIPQVSRGRVNHDIYAVMENAINNVINEQSEVDEGTYYIDRGSVLTADDDEVTNANNAYFTFIKSFVVVIDEPSEVPTHFGDLYIGFGESSVSTKEEIEHLANVQYYDQASAVGDYSIMSPNESYLWICTTAKVNEVVSSGFTVPMQEMSKVEDLNCYRSGNSILQGEMNFSIR
jgi:hypothetical protein